jgi:BirA family biotin operon repressor/biotin-[acetyl-CoA-carboxylase] ligase
VRWPCEAVWETVVPALPGFSVEVLPEIDSTNSELMRRARAGRVEPVLLVAERQSAGRGRLGRGWESSGPAETLTFSLGLPLAPLQWAGLSLAVGVAVAQSLHPALQLKWPNDIWLEGRKLAGILIETVSVGEARYTVIGVGINIRIPNEQGLRTAPAGLIELIPQMDAPAALGRVVGPLVDGILQFAEQGFARSRAAYAARDALSGQHVQCSDGVEGQARGVDETGALLVHTAAGLKKISSAEVSVRPMAAVSTNRC